ncbi:MucBP domain-containing protein [Enterococcus faecalis]|uniref:MucBP domain-containing protein n=1 Tax=Enterococcus faecalis TaxID=1351 RepID=UPI00115E3360|nr:MucBP domain-containing protein [Enterococcus faecalis]
MSKIVKKLSSIALLTIVGASLGASGLQLNSNILGNNTVANAEELDKIENVDKTEKTIESTEVTQSNQEISEVEIKDNTVKEIVKEIPQITGESREINASHDEFDYNSISPYYNLNIDFEELDLFIEPEVVSTNLEIDKVGEYQIVYRVTKKSGDKLDILINVKVTATNPWFSEKNTNFWYKLNSANHSDVNLATTLPINFDGNLTTENFVEKSEVKAFDDVDGDITNKIKVVGIKDPKGNKIENIEGYKFWQHGVYMLELSVTNSFNLESTFEHKAYVNIDFIQTINYLDENGNQIAESDSNFHDWNGNQEYVTYTAKEIEGYEPLEKTINLKPEAKDQVINFVYKKKIEPIVETGKVIVNYLDEDGNKIVESKEILDFIGNKYFVSAIDIDGYIFNEQVSIRNQGGVFTKEDSIINFIYKKVVKPTEPTEPTNPVVPEPKQPVDPTEPTTPTDPEKPTDNGDGNGNVVTDTNKETTKEDSKEKETTKEDKKDKLYQTNHNSDNILIALATTALASVLAFITFKRFKK